MIRRIYRDENERQSNFNSTRVFASRSRTRDHLYFISYLRNHFADCPVPSLRPLQALLTAARGATGADYTISRRSVSHELGIGQVNESFPRQFRVIIEQIAAPLG